jgi:N-acetyl-anhydromuramyl-L-alanine amidase AmpD
MLSSSGQQMWHKLLQASSLFAFSVLLTVLVFERVYPNGGRKPASVSAKSDVASPYNSASRVPNARVPNVQVPNIFEPQIEELRHLYQAAPKLSIDELMARKEFEPENGLDLPIALSQPPEQFRIDAHSSNFGNRLIRNHQGKSLQNKLLVVLHETTSAASGAVNTALTPHAHDADQISYHAVICQDGTILYLVDPHKRAYGAGYSAFKGPNGIETVQTNKKLKSSVNNFAYHISLETPSDGYDDQTDHSGYTEAQYSSLAWLIAHSGVERNRITTHLAIDQSGERQDPRSFEMPRLQQDLALQVDNFISLDTTKMP